MEMFDSMCRSSMYLSSVLNIVTGSEDELALKRRMDEMIWYPHDTDDLYRKYYGGSRSEGLWLPGSDMDVMLVFSDTIVVSPTVESDLLMKWKHHHILIMRNDNCRPGHVILQVGNISVGKKSLFQMAIVKHKGLSVVSSNVFRSKLASLHSGIVEHGPCASILDNPDVEIDLATAFHCPDWPDIARDWITRSRPHGWPTASMIDSIVKGGCHVVPIGDKTSENASVEWRVSFCRAERSLIHSLNHIQFKVYTLLKLFLKQVINKHEEVRDLISSYFLKTVVFFVVENTPKQFWSNGGVLFINYQNCLNMLTQWVREGYCPNYFVPKNNMFLGRVFGQGQQDLIKILDRYRLMGLNMLKECEYFKHLNTSPSMKDLVDLELTFRNAKESEFRRDTIFHVANSIMHPPDMKNALRSVRRAVKHFADSVTDEEEDCRWILLLNNLLAMLSMSPTKWDGNSYDSDTKRGRIPLDSRSRKKDNSCVGPRNIKTSVANDIGKNTTEMRSDPKPEGCNVVGTDDTAQEEVDAPEVLQLEHDSCTLSVTNDMVKDTAQMQSDLTSEYSATGTNYFGGETAHASEARQLEKNSSILSVANDTAKDTGEMQSELPDACSTVETNDSLGATAHTAIQQKHTCPVSKNEREMDVTDLPEGGASHCAGHDGAGYYTEKMADCLPTKYTPGNKERYKEIRRCKYSLMHCTGIDVTKGRLTLATYLYTHGSYKQALQILRQVRESVQPYTIFKSSSGGIQPNSFRDNAYKAVICGRGLSIRNKMSSTLSLDMFFSDNIRFCPDELKVLMEDTLTGFHVPPLPYACFMTYLCCRMLGNDQMESQALGDLQKMTSHDEQGVQKHPVVHNLLGVCLELSGDVHGAIDQYTESLRRRPTYNGASKRLTDLGIEMVYHRPL